ncbi:DUF3659 domain-containing protein [Enterococcus faecalis]|nr:DUF3659 domain-containing protein [Enterococcus faecalis]
MIKNFLKQKKWIITGAFITIVLAFTLPFSFNEETRKADNLQQAEITSEAKKLMGTPTEAFAASIKPEAGIWTLYARLLMGNKDVEEGAKSTGQMKLMGSGGVSVDFPFTDLAQTGNDLDGNKAGEQLSALLATYSYYGYIETVSGNAIAATAVGGFYGFLRSIGSLIAGVAISISSIAEKINSALADLFMTLNPPSWVGYGTTEDLAQKNPIGKAFQSLLENLGLNNKFFRALADLSLIIFTGVLGFKLMKMLSESKFSSNLNQPLKNWIVRILVLGLFMPMLGMFLNSIIQEIQSAKEDGQLPTTIVNSYIINTRLWAATQNLAPDSTLGGGKTPNADATSAQKFIDPSYEPAKKKALIESINRMSYAAYGGKLDPGAQGMALLKEWSSNSTFNVNTYAGDVNIAKEDILMSNIPAKAPAANKGIKDPTNLSGYIWSADQNVTDENRMPTGKGTEVPFDSSATWGVEGNRTFSTQSVALLLQSELNASGAKFYAYNLAPTGVQAAAKNMTTIKTEWRTASLVGHTGLGKAGAWIAMIAESLVQGLYYLACAFVLFRISLIEYLKKTITRIFQVATLATPAAAAGLLALSLGMIGVAIMSLGLPSILIGLSRAFSKTAVGFVPSNLLIDGIENLVNALFAIGTCFFIAIPTKFTKTTPLKTMMSMPLELAYQIDKHASRIMGNRNMASRMVNGSIQGMNRELVMNGGYESGTYRELFSEAMKNAGVGRSETNGKETNTQIPNDGYNSPENNNGSYTDIPEKSGSRKYVEDIKDNRQTDDLGRLVNEKGQLISPDGKVINTRDYGYDSDGRRIDQVGRLVDEKGELIDVNGNHIKAPSSEFVDKNNTPFEKEVYGVNENGQKVDEKGRLVDENGNLIDADGNRILASDFGQDGSGRLVDDLGRLVDEDGLLVDEKGNKLDKNELGYTVGGLRVDDDGEIQENGNTGISKEEYNDSNGDLIKHSPGEQSKSIDNSLASSSIDGLGRTQNTIVDKNKRQSTKKREGTGSGSTDRKNDAKKDTLKNSNSSRENKNPKKTRKEKGKSPLMKKAVSHTAAAAKVLDNSLKEAPKGSLAHMTYATKEAVKIPVKGATTAARKYVKQNTEEKKDENN